MTKVSATGFIISLYGTLAFGLINPVPNNLLIGFEYGMYFFGCTLSLWIMWKALSGK